MPVRIAPMATDDPYHDPQAANKRAIAAAQALGVKASDTSAPVYSKGHGMAKVLLGGLAGLTEGMIEAKEKREQQEASQLLAAALMGSLPSTGTPSVAPSPTPGPQSNAGGGDEFSAVKRADQRRLFEGLTQRGLPPVAAAGILGNFHGESGFRPDIVGDRGTSYGLAQWRGPRFQALQQLAQSQGKDWRDPDVQLDHLVNELKGPEKRAMAALLQAQTPEDASNAFMRHFERPAAWAMAQSGPKRAGFARTAFDQYGVPPATQVAQNVPIPQPRPEFPVSGELPDVAMPAPVIPDVAPAPDWQTAQVTPEQFDAQLDTARTMTAGTADIVPTPRPRPDLPVAQPAFDPSLMARQLMGADYSGSNADMINFDRQFGRGAVGVPMPAAIPAGGSAPVEMSPQARMQPAPGGFPFPLFGAPQPQPQIPTQALPGTDSQKQLLGALLMNPRTAGAGMQLWKHMQEQAQTKTVDMGDALGVMDARGNLLRTIPKVVPPVIVGEGATAIDRQGRPLFQAPPKNEKTPDQNNFEEAQRGGYKGDFNSFLQQKTQRPPQVVTIKRADGSEESMIYDPVTNTLKTPEQMGAPAGSKAAPNPYALPGKSTEGERTSALYANRSVESHRIISELENVGTDWTQDSASKVPIIGNVLISKEKQRLLQAQRDFVNAILRKESGAVINPDEFDNATKQYFPQPGDSNEVIAQKRQNRLIAVKGLMGAAGQQYQPPDWFKQEQSKTNDDGWQEIAPGVRIREKK